MKPFKVRRGLPKLIRPKILACSSVSNTAAYFPYWGEIHIRKDIKGLYFYIILIHEYIHWYLCLSFGLSEFKVKYIHDLFDFITGIGLFIIRKIKEAIR